MSVADGGIEARDNESDCSPSYGRVIPIEEQLGENSVTPRQGPYECPGGGGLLLDYETPLHLVTGSVCIFLMPMSLFLHVLFGLTPGLFSGEDALVRRDSGQV